MQQEHRINGDQPLLSVIAYQLSHRMNAFDIVCKGYEVFVGIGIV